MWLTCRLVPRIPAAAQSALWWLVALKLVLVFAPVPALPVPLLPADFQRHTERIFLQPLTSGEGEKLISSWQAADSSVVGEPDRVLVSPINSWFRALLLVWLAALLVQAGRLVLAHRQLRGIVRRSVAWEDVETVKLARRIGLTRTPPVRISDEIDSPQVCGLWSPVVLVPRETMKTLSVEERTMTLCHELMHIRRRDLAFGWVPACAERLFFFHPFARLSAREYVAAREAACDAGAVHALGVSASDYGRMLVRLGLGNAMPGLTAGGSPFSASSLKRRLHLLEHHRLATISARWRWAIAVIAAVVIPLQLVARTPDAPPQKPGPKFDLAALLKHTLTKAQAPEKQAVKLEKLVVAAQPQAVKLAKAVVDEPQTVELEKLVAAAEPQTVELKVLIEKLKDKIYSESGKDQEIRVTIAKLMETVEQERSAEEQADRSKRREQLAAQVEAQVRALAEAQKAIERADSEKVTAAEFYLGERLREQNGQPDRETQQRLQQLADRLERVVAEQHQLIEEIRRLQKQSPR